MSAVLAASESLFETWYDDPDQFDRDIWPDALPEKWQTEASGLVAAHDRVAIRSGHGVGKALHVDEPVLTPHGWVKIGDIRVGDTVMSVDGNPTKVLGVFPQGMRNLFRVTMDDGSSVLADGEHLWSTKTRSARKHGGVFETRSTAQIAKSLFFENGPTKGLNHQIPVCEAIQHPFSLLPIEPYLFGCWLGDGGTSGRITGEAPQLEQLMVAGSDISNVYHDLRRPNVMEMTFVGMQTKLRGLGVHGLRSHEKFIPSVYKFSSVDQRKALLQGLLDTDGTCQKNGAVCFDVTSEKLADDTAELCRSLGGVVRRSGKQGRLNGVYHRWVYRLYISLPRDISPFRLWHKAGRYHPKWGDKNCDRTRRRFISNIEPAGTGDAVCISVDHPSKLYVTKNHIVTHNTAWLARRIIWWGSTRYPWKIGCTAPSSSQMFDALWSEIAKWHSKMPEGMKAKFEWKTERFEFRENPQSGFAVAKTARRETPEALAGLHSENMLFIIDESAGVDDIIFETARGAMSTVGAKTIMTGNPTRLTGYFFDAFHKNRQHWATMKVAAHESTRCNLKELAQWREEYGEDSNFYRVRALGEFPTAEDDVIIPLYMVEAAVNRDVEQIPSDEVWGLDVSRAGVDLCALAKRRGNVMHEPVRTWRSDDAMVSVGKVVQEYQDAVVKPVSICVDSIGLGAPVADRLAELGLPVTCINVSESHSSNDRYLRLRDEMWERARSWFYARDCKIVRDEPFMGEISLVKWAPTSNGKMKVVTKAEMKKDMHKSPDRSEAFCFTFMHSGGIQRKPRPIVYPRRGYA